MAICLLATGMAFFIPVNAPDDHCRVGLVAAAIYLYVAFYHPGEGHVRFTYSAEAFPLYIRDFGMSYATAVCWFFNFILAITFPLMLTAFKPQGAFGWYDESTVNATQPQVDTAKGKTLYSTSQPVGALLAGWPCSLPC